MLTEYIQAAMAHAVIEYDPEDKKYYGEIPPCPGVLGVGDSPEACRRDLQEALEGWMILAFRFGDPLPVIDGIDLNQKIAA
ncbi:MAG: type II toxin-antitoxin system HicB family antitoxin [Caldilineae bacterium]|nr:MAG: type II toxin-antitoxin system HicB family antitoxin [Caldilineae bacterium]